jgi:hypothetical protein
VITVRVGEGEDPTKIVRDLGLPIGGPVIVVIGGAGAMDEQSLRACAPLFTSVIAPSAERAHAVVVDGGTDVGVMRLMGAARRASGAGFPLLGVAPDGALATPGEADGSGRAQPEPNHSHLALVPECSFGDESPWLAAIAATLAAGRSFPTLLMNGGPLALNDVEHIVAVGGYVVAIDGTGRSADRLAAAVAGSSDHRVEDLIASGRVYAEPLDTGRLLVAVEGALAPEREGWPT